jgi:hypothetical protein
MEMKGNFTFAWPMPAGHAGTEQGECGSSGAALRAIDACIGLRQ